eukprot:SAG11_NODE_2000_length_3942_cov_47.649753_3_plen_146_part_00
MSSDDEDDFDLDMEDSEEPSPPAERSPKPATTIHIVQGSASKRRKSQPRPPNPAKGKKVVPITAGELQTIAAENTDKAMEKLAGCLEAAVEKLGKQEAPTAHAGMDAGLLSFVQNKANLPQEVQKQVDEQSTLAWEAFMATRGNK